MSKPTQHKFTPQTQQYWEDFVRECASAQYSPSWGDVEECAAAHVEMAQDVMGYDEVDADKVFCDYCDYIVAELIKHNLIGRLNLPERGTDG